MWNMPLDTSGLSAGLQKSIEVLWEGREMSSEIKTFFNDFENLSPEMQKHWETYYKNLERAQLAVNTIKASVGEQKSCFEGGPSAHGRLTAVENGGKAAVVGGGGTVVLPGATIGRTEAPEHMKKNARTFGIIGLLNPESTPPRCPK